MRIGLAIRAFFGALFDGDVTVALEQVLSGPASSDDKGGQVAEATIPPTDVAPSAARNDAITLLSALQREARFIDLVQESLTDYSDAQIGAAARDVLRDSRSVLDRFFAIKPIVDAEDGAELQTPDQVDAARYRLAGQVSGAPPFSGQLLHHGWEASRCELPQWSGGDDVALVVAPVELEVT